MGDVMGYGIARFYKADARYYVDRNDIVKCEDIAVKHIGVRKGYEGKLILSGLVWYLNGEIIADHLGHCRDYNICLEKAQNFKRQFIKDGYLLKSNTDLFGARTGEDFKMPEILLR